MYYISFVSISTQTHTNVHTCGHRFQRGDDDARETADFWNSVGVWWNPMGCPSDRTLVRLIRSRQPRRNQQPGDQPFHFFLCSMNQRWGEMRSCTLLSWRLRRRLTADRDDDAGWGVSGRWHNYPFHVSKKCRDEAGSCVCFPATLCPTWWYHQLCLCCGCVWRPCQQ